MGWDRKFLAFCEGHVEQDRYRDNSVFCCTILFLSDYYVDIGAVSSVTRNVLISFLHSHILTSRVLFLSYLLSEESVKGTRR